MGGALPDVTLAAEEDSKVNRTRIKYDSTGKARSRVIGGLKKPVNAFLTHGYGQNHGGHGVGNWTDRVTGRTAALFLVRQQGRLPALP